LTPRFALAAREHVAALFGRDAATAAAPGAASSAPLADAVPTVLSDETNPPVAVALAPARPLPPHQPAGDDTAPRPRSFSGDTATDQRLAAEHQARWKLLEQRKLDPNRPPSGSPGGYRRMTDLRVSTTDPDATPLNTSERGKLGYHDHDVVDGGKARIIVACW
jgi:hypothetical protein